MSNNRLDSIFEGGEGQQTLKRGGARERQRRRQEQQKGGGAASPAAGGLGEADAPRDLLMLSGQSLEDWVERAFTVKRGAKVRSGFHISEEHGFRAEEIRTFLRRNYRLSGRDASLANIVETSLDLMYETLGLGEAHERDSER